MRGTGIEWTDATWNPIRGCSRVSEGCRNCYAETVANRFCGPGKPYEGVVQIDPATGKGNGLWNGEIKFVEKHLLNPLRWKKPLRIFVNSMSDLFHPNVTDEMLDRIFAVMALCPQHTFQVLTKRPERMLAYLTPTMHNYQPANIFDAADDILESLRGGYVNRLTRWPLQNVWLGTSVEDQPSAEKRIPYLLQTPAAVRFISAEPLLGLVKVQGWLGRSGYGSCFGCTDPDPLGATHCEGTVQHPIPAGIDWVIVGGESGLNARPMHPDWARDLRDQCGAAGVPFFFKQWGELAPGAQQADYSRKLAAFTRINVEGNPSNDPTKWLASDALFYCVGKQAAGRLLDGREWNEMPSVQAVR